MCVGGGYVHQKWPGTHVSATVSERKLSRTGRLYKIIEILGKLVSKDVLKINIQKKFSRSKNVVQKGILNRRKKRMKIFFPSVRKFGEIKKGRYMQIFGKERGVYMQI